MKRCFLGLSIRIDELFEKNLDDRIKVCGENQPLDNPSLQRGVREKKQWLRKMLKSTGPPTKILYSDNKPAGQVQYYPETSIPYLSNPNPKSLHVMCSFVHLSQQNKGYGTQLFQSLLEQVKRESRYDRIETVGFDPPGCGYSQTEFWKKMGFATRPGGNSNQLQYTIKGELTSPRLSQPKTVRERGVKIFYAPTCIFSHYFIDQTVNALRAVDPAVNPERVNMWESPAEAKARDLDEPTIYINGHPMKSSIFDPEAFKKEAQSLLQAQGP